jgi:hypothetical protein
MAEPETIRMGVTHLVIPRRTADMPSGAEISRQLRQIIGDVMTQSEDETRRRRVQAEEYIFQQVRMGNVPDFMRPENYSEVTFERTIGGRTIRATVRVCPDYLAIGSNDDHMLVPLSAPVAQRVADNFGLSLPTGLVVDTLDAEARRTGGYLRFYAAPTLAEGVTNSRTGKPAVEGEGGRRWNNQQYGGYEGRWMLSAEFITEQNRLITEARGRAGNPSGIRSGHKKDVIYDPFNFIKCREGGGQPVVIYHRGIQGLSYEHTVSYTGDYSHGIRFLDANISLRITERDGSVRQETRTFSELANDPQLYQLISYGRVDTRQLYRGVQIPLHEPPPRPVTPPNRETQRH